MTVDMTKWQDMARANAHIRPAGSGRMAGKICIVTGAAQGFGRGIAQELYNEGASIVIADLNEPLAGQVAAEMGERAFAVAVNVSDEESVANMVAQTVERFGGLDLMLSNAGVVRSGPVTEMEKKDFDFVTSINYTGYFLCSKYAAMIMQAQHEAAPEAMYDIVELNSKSGLEGSNRNFAYAGSKFGGIGLTQSFALELCAYNIKVNAVCPGNYLDGPLWSDPERGLFVQYLRAGKVPGARTVQDVRRHYEAKVPMNRGCLPSDVAKADAAAGASKLDSAAKTAVKNGLPYIGYSYSAASSASDLIAGVEYTELDGAMDCLTPVVYPNKTLVNASYIADGDGILYAYGLGYFSQIPAGAAVLVKSDKTRTPTEGFVPTNTAERVAGFKAYMNGGVQGFAYKENGMNVVLFANSLTHKVHQRDEYAYISNFLFSSVLSDKNYDGSESVALPFTDVAEGAYYADAVAWAIQNKVTSGVSATTFAPNASCTRGQMVTFLWKAAGSPEPKSLTTAFTDVKGGAYYEKAVAWAVENKVTTGTSATTFSPDATVTRGQSVTFLWKANNSPAAEGTSAFTDVAAGVYYAPAVAWAVEKGVTSGMSATTFSPNSNCTRAQIVTFLYRAASAK